MNKIKEGIFSQNPLFASLLGLCPALATTKSLESAIGMGMLFIFVLVCSNVCVSLIRKITPNEVKIPILIIVIATFVTICKMLTEAFLPDLYQTLGVFISLIVVNCIVLGRAEVYASKNGVLSSFLDAIGAGVGYLCALCIIAFIREFLGTGGITFGNVLTFLPNVSFLPLEDYAIKMMIQPAGAFLTLSVVLAIIKYLKDKKGSSV